MANTVKEYLPGKRIICTTFWPYSGCIEGVLLNLLSRTSPACPYDATIPWPNIVSENKAEQISGGRAPVRNRMKFTLSISFDHGNLLYRLVSPAIRKTRYAPFENHYICCILNFLLSTFRYKADRKIEIRSRDLVPEQ